jgi:colicin import membrane protein
MSGVISRLQPYFLSIALHAALVAVILVLGVQNWRAEPEVPQVIAIEAVAIEAEELARLTRRVPPKQEEPPPSESRPEPKPEPKPEPTPEPKPAPKKPVVKPVEPAKPTPVNPIEERRKAEAARREIEAQRMKDELEAEDRRRAEDARIRAEREAALQRALSEETAAAEAAEARRVAAARAATLSAQWAAAIQARVQRAWIRPPSAESGLDCRVAVTQAAGGTVIRAEVKECNGDESVRQSLEAAVFRASPLPPPPDPALFERNIELRFRPND